MKRTRRLDQLAPRWSEGQQGRSKALDKMRFRNRLCNGNNVGSFERCDNPHLEGVDYSAVASVGCRCGMRMRMRWVGKGGWEGLERHLLERGEAARGAMPNGRGQWRMVSRPVLPERHRGGRKKRWNLWIDNPWTDAPRMNDAWPSMGDGRIIVAIDFEVDNVQNFRDGSKVASSPLLDGTWLPAGKKTWPPAT